MDEFSFRDDLASVRWGPTARVNFFRALALNTAVAGFMLVEWFSHPSWAGLGRCAVQPLGGAVGYLIFAPFMLVVAKTVSAVAPGSAGETCAKLLMGLLGLPIALFGDPLVYLLRKKKPDLVPVEGFKPCNFALIIFVLDQMRGGRK